jgi:DNA-binding response OmpR family regulator
MRLLIVEDEKSLADILKKGLEEEGYAVDVAYDGEEGLFMAENETSDLIILDIMLPKLDGYKICRLLKFDERYKHIPILMLTAKTQEKDKIIGMETGADEYINKPFEMEELIKKVKAYLNK